VEGASTGSLTVATFTDQGDASGTRSSTTADFTADIHWGDGQSSAGMVTYSNGTYLVNGSHTYVEEGSYAVIVDVGDDGGSILAAIGKTTVAVLDAPLTDTTVTTALSAPEGASTGDQIVGTFTDADPGAIPTDYTATVCWGDNTSSAASSITLSGGIFSVHGAHTYAEEGIYHPYAVVTDNEGNANLTTGGSTVSTSPTLITETVTLVAPVAGVSGPGNGVPGQPRTFTFTATDACPTDQAAGFVYTIRWGDGTAPLTIPRTAGNGAGVAVDHIYTTPGTYTVQVTATEDGGDTSGPAISIVTVQNVQMQGNTLAVGGTPGNDTVILSPADTTGDINVKYNGKSLGNFKPTDHILVYGQSGNDMIQLAGKQIKGRVYYITVPAFLYGGGTGKNKDILDASGSTANNVLQGGGGTNILTGGRGRDILIAGRGASQLHAGRQDDILIGGWTDYDLTSPGVTSDQKLAALEAIMSEWGSTTDNYAIRVQDLSQGGGLNGFGLLSAQTVHRNGKADTLFGAATASPALDWFFADSVDIVRNKKKNRELQTAIS
jgi:PKD repeat protein